MIEEYGGFAPEVGRDAFVADSARLIGRVSVADKASVWFAAVLRGDLDWIRVGEGTNVQDGAVLHADAGTPVEVGRWCMIGHGAILHSCRVGDGCLIGMGAIVLDGVEVGDGSIVGAGAVVPAGTKVAPGSLLVGVPARVIRELLPEERGRIRAQAERYHRTALTYLKR